MKKVCFLSCGQLIQGTLITPKNLQKTNPGVIFFHGMTSSEKNYIPIAELLADNNIVGITLSIRGHGESEGDFNKLTVKDAFEDGLSAYDYFCKYDFIDKERIGICGASVGASIASFISERRPVKSLVLRAPAVYSEQMISMTYKQIMGKEGQIFQAVESMKDTAMIKAISQFKGSLLVVASENDSIIPKEISQEYFNSAYEAVKKEIFQIQGATHNLSEEKWRKQFINKTVRWFTENL